MSFVDNLISEFTAILFILVSSQLRVEVRVYGVK